MSIKTWEENKKKLPDLEKFAEIKNPFLQDIFRKAYRYKLTDKQIAAAQKSYDRVKGKIATAKAEAIKLSKSDIETILWSIEQMIQMKGMYGGGDFWYDMRDRVERKKTLSPKQYAAMIKSMTRYKKAFFKRVFKERR